MRRLLGVMVFCGVLVLPMGNGVAMQVDKATFAGGCFWCMQSPFDKLEGVVKTIVGYTGSTEEREPTYELVSSGKTQYAEAVEVYFNSDAISFEKVVAVFWQNIDPFVKNRQFCDVGGQYRTAIFYHNVKQKEWAMASKQALEQKLNQGSFATEIVPATPFYPAEDYHQDYYKKNPIRYQFYRYQCGRDKRLKAVWGEG